MGYYKNAKLENIFLGSSVELYRAEEKEHRRLLCYLYAVRVEIAMPVTVVEKKIVLLQVSVYFHWAKNDFKAFMAYT